MFAKLTAMHPSVETLFQPLNSSVFRREMFSYWTPGSIHPEGRTLMDSVFSGNWDDSVIKSHWFFAHSTNLEFDPDKIYLIKTTNAHLKFGWLKNQYPYLKLVALLRNPLGILSSLIRNKLIEEWYSPLMVEECFEKYGVSNPENEYKIEKIRQVARMDHLLNVVGMIGILNSIMIKDVDPGNIIKYEQLIQDPNDVLNNNLLKEYDLIDFDFKAHLSKDYNIIGASPKSRIDYIDLVDGEVFEKTILILKEFDYLGYADELAAI